MLAKLFLTIPLILGCLGLVMAVLGTVMPNWWLGALKTPETWWRGAIACWMLIVAVRMVYSVQAK